MNIEEFIVFDVETIGLNGRAFAVGWVVLGGVPLRTIEEGWATEGLAVYTLATPWMVNNIPAEVLAAPSLPVHSPRVQFMGVMERHPNAILVADVPVPCEARFLQDAGINAYPVLDVATALYMAGRDPTGTYARQPDELPAHHPLNDARHSARIWRELLVVDGDEAEARQDRGADHLTS